MPAREPEQVDYLLAEAFNAQDLEACVVLHDPEASVVRLDVFGERWPGETRASGR
jgi:hypothetical protein